MAINLGKDLKQGFTLIEVLLVIAITAILTGVGSAYLGGTITNSTLEDAATVVIFDIRNAQTRAMNGIDNKKWGVCFRNPAGDDSYELVSLSSGDACSGTVDTTVFLQDGVTYSEPTSGNTTSVVFDKITGEITSTSNVVITLTLKEQLRSITITPSGRIY